MRPGRRGAGGGEEPASRLPPRLIAMAPGFPKTWEPRCPPTWAAVPIPCPPAPSLPPPWRRPPASSRHSSGTPSWDTHGPLPSPTPPGGVQEPPQGRARWLGRAGTPPARANRYGGIVGHLPGRPLRGEGPETAAAGFAHRGEERGEDAGGGDEERGRSEGGGGMALTSGRAGAHSPEARVPRRGGAAPGGSLRGPRGEGGRLRAPAGSSSPRTHTPSGRPRPRAGIPGAAGSHGAPGRSPGASPPSAGSALRALPPCLSLSPLPAPVWGSRAPHPARRAPLPRPLPLPPAVRSPGARAQPMCAAASQRPGAQWPRPRRRSCAPWKLHAAPASSRLLPPRRAPRGLEAPRPPSPPRAALARAGSRDSGLGSAARAALPRGSGSPHPHAVALPITKLPRFPGSSAT